MKILSGSIGRGFWIRWVIASSVGSGAGVLLWVAVGSTLEAAQIGGQTSQAQVLQGAVAGVMFGASFGVGQWLVLRRHLERAGQWVLATAVGYAVVFLLGASLIPGGDAVDLGPATQIALGAVLGAAVAIPPGLLQWLLVLRRQVRGAGWWVPASSVSWSVGFAISFAIRLWLGELTFISGPAVAIGLTGFALVRLLQPGSPVRS